MQKRKCFLLFALLIILALAICLMVTACGDSGNNDGVTPTKGLKYRLSGDGTYYVVTGVGTSSDTNIVIDETYNGLPVKSIGRSAFQNCKSLTSVVIPDSVTFINMSAFENCVGLTNVTLGDNVRTISHYAFNNCTSLTSIEFPNSVIDIGASAFGNCTSLTNIAISDNVITIGAGAFENTGYYNNSSNWENGILYIEKYLIKAKTEISGAYSIKEDTKVIAYCAFEDCLYVTNVTIPDSVTCIGGGAYLNCSSLISVTIGNSVTSIGEYAFDLCYKLIEVYNKSDINIVAASSDSSDYGYIGYYAKNIYNNEGESKLITSGDYIFYNDNGTYYLMGYTGEETDIVLPKNVNENNYAIYKYALNYCDGLTSIEIPDSVTSIGSSAFSGCASLTSVTIGNSVTSIGEFAFWNCDNLTEVYYKGTSSEWAEIEISLFNSELTSATRYYYSETQPTISGNYWHYVDGVVTKW